MGTAKRTGPAKKIVASKIALKTVTQAAESAPKSPNSGLETIHAIVDMKGGNVQSLIPLQVPQFVTSSVVMQATGNDFLLVISQTVPLMTVEGKFTNAAKNVPIAMVTMSPQTAKDLCVLVSNTITKFEKDFGEITTPYTRAIAAQKKPAVAKAVNGKKAQR